MDTEQSMIERGVAVINRGRKGRWIGNLVLWGICIVLFVTIITLLPASFECDEIRGYKGSRPTYESVEPKIMNSLFDVDFTPGKTDKDTITLVTDYDYLVPYLASTGITEIRQVKEAGDFDYTALEFETHGLYRSPYDSYVDPDLKKTDMYKKTTEEARALFEAELDRRDAEVRAYIRPKLLILLLIIVVYGAISYLVVKKCTDRGKKHLDAIRNGQARVKPATLVGKNEYHSRYNHIMSILVNTAERKDVEIKAVSAQIERFEAGKKCYIITYPAPGNEGDTDTYYADLVWDGLA